MTTARTPLVRLLGGAGVTALTIGVMAAMPPASAQPGAPSGAPASAQSGAVAASAPLARKAGDVMVVRNERQLRRAVRRANRRDGMDRIRIARSIQFNARRRDRGGALRGDLDVSDDLAVVGRHRWLDANGVDRIFDVAPDTRLVLRRVRMMGGSPAAGESGGAVRSQGTVRLVRSTAVRNGVTGTGASGGALMNDGGTLRVVRSRLAGNNATRAGGAIEANAGVTSVRGSRMLRNDTGGEPGNGGALHLTGAGTVDVHASEVRGNTATAEGGGLWNSATGTFTVSDTMLVGNVARGADADQGGGGLYNDGGDLRVTGSTIWRNDATGASGSGGGFLNNAGTLVVTGSRVADNNALRAGGGIEANAGSTEVTGSMLEDNTTGAAPGNGGAFHLTGAGTVAVSDSTVRNNTAAAEGGGLWNSAGGTFSVSGTTLTGNRAAGADADQGGGALYNDGGQLTVTGSTVDGNAATGASGSGGGILNNAGALEVSDTTFADNDAPRAGGAIEANVGTTTLSGVEMTGNTTGAAPGNGGGLHLTGAGTVTWTGGSVTGNQAANEGGGLWNSATGTMTVMDVEVTGNQAPTGPDAYNDGGVFVLNGVPVPPG